MTDIGKELRATSDSLMRDLELLAELEAEKRTLQPGDPRLVELAERVEAAAIRLTGASSRQRDLTQAAEVLVDRDDPAAPAESIEATPRDIPAILTEWRDVERRAQELEPGSPEASDLARRSDELRREYQAAHEATRHRTDERRRAP